MWMSQLIRVKSIIRIHVYASRCFVVACVCARVRMWVSMHVCVSVFTVICGPLSFGVISFHHLSQISPISGSRPFLDKHAVDYSNSRLPLWHTHKHAHTLRQPVGTHHTMMTVCVPIKPFGQKLTHCHLPMTLNCCLCMFLSPHFRPLIYAPSIRQRFPAINSLAKSELSMSPWSHLFSVQSQDMIASVSEQNIWALVETASNL